MKLSFWPCLALAIPFAFAPAPARAQQRLDGIAAVVNDDVVLQSDVEEQLALIMMRAPNPPDSQTVDTLRTQILNQLIEEKLIVAEAKKQGITVSDAEIAKELERALADVKQRVGGEQAFRDQMTRENTTEAKLRDKYRNEIQRQLLATKLVQKQLPKHVVTQAEAEAYFKAHPDKFPKVPPELKLAVIQIPATADSATEADAKAQIAAVRRRILNGEKFAKVAAEKSDDAPTARSGGDLGFLLPGSLDEPLEKVIAKLKIGELSQPVRSSVGWHVLEVIERDTVKTQAGKDSLDATGKPVPEAHVRHILIHVTVGEADADRARKAADKVRAEAVKGTPFTDLVHKYSKYQGPVDADGNLGFVSLGTLQPQIREGLDSLKVGAISEVLPNQVGFNIFKVFERKPERTYQLDEIKDELPDAVSQLKQRDRYDEWIKSLRAKAHIEIRTS